jgi:hypothetical protein
MVFTLQHNIFIGMAYFEVGFIIHLLVGTTRFKQRIITNQIRELFPEFLVTFDAIQQHFMLVVEGYLNIGNVTKQKPTGRPFTLNEEVIEDIRTQCKEIPTLP